MKWVYAKNYKIVAFTLLLLPLDYRHKEFPSVVS